MLRGFEQGDPLLLGGVLLLSALVAARLARALGLPSLTGQLAAGVAVGALWPQAITSYSEALAAVGQAAGAGLLFWIGCQLTAGGRPRGRLTAWLAAPALAAAVSCGIALAVTMPPGQRSWCHIALAAIALAAASPTIVGLVTRELGAGDRSARAAMAATVAVNAVIALAVVALLALAQADERTFTAAGMARDLAAGTAVGGALAVLAARAGSRVSPASQVTLAVCAFLVLRGALVHHELAIMAGSLCAGALFASAREHRARRAGAAFASARDRRVPGQPLPAYVGLASAVAFVVAGAAIDLPAALALALPAAVIAGVRAAALWLGARVVGAVSGEAAATHLGFAALLPQAELSLALLASFAAAGALPAPVISLVFAVAAINLVAAPPLLGRALRAAQTPSHPPESRAMKLTPNAERS